MQKSATSTGNAWRPEEGEREENDITQPLRIISSRTPSPSFPRRPRGTWFKKQEQPAAEHTPDFIEIGDPQA